MKHIAQLLLLLPLLWAVGCQKESSRQEREMTGTKGEAPVQIHASLATSTPATKSIIRGTDIPDQFSYGLFVCTEGNTDEAHKMNSWNLKSSYAAGLEGEAGTWSFQYIDDYGSGELSANTYDYITITSKEDENGNSIKADLYAYAPYIKGTFSPTAIPFSIAKNNYNQIDLMYAEENDLPAINKGLDPLANVEKLEANFTFKHALALLVFEFEIKNHNNAFSTKYLLNNITIKKINPENNTEAHLYKSGYFNAITPTFYNCSEVDALSVSITNDLGDNFAIIPVEGGPDATAYVALVPTKVEDDELEIVITLNSHPTKPFVIKKENLRHNGGEFGFQGGYKYTFSFTMDNYLYLDDFSISEWDDQEYPLETVEI